MSATAEIPARPGSGPAAGRDPSAALLEVRDLSTSFFTPHGELKAVDRVSFTVARQEVLGVVGESGSGKTMTALSLMRLIDPPGRIVGGSVRLDGEELLSKSEPEMRKLRGRAMAMIWQDPMASLNPVKRIGAQVGEAIRIHGRDLSARAVRARVIELMEMVNMPDPARRARDYPHQLSGGLLQRAMIAMALACQPSLLIADEPTTALDVTIQFQILELLKRLQAEHGMSILLITHDLGIVAETCQRVHVMYAGQIVESAPTAELFDAPLHPYTASLLQSMPRHDTRRGELVAIRGTVPDLHAIPPGCPFHPRCPRAMDICRERVPDTVRQGTAHAVRCHLHG